MYSMEYLHELKTRILQHRKPDEWGVKERGRIAQYDNYKKSIIQRIEMIEESTIKVAKHMKTIEEWLAVLMKWGIEFIPTEKVEKVEEEKETRQSKVLPEE